MAEGGPQPDDDVIKDNTSTQVSQLLECPICLEQIRNPKSLPCLHSFCEECLGTYIVTDLSGEMAAVTSFPCPVCRKITSPVNPSEKKEMWAQQFPANSLIKDYINRARIGESPCYCDSCRKSKHEEVPAIMLCKTNGMLFCELCKVNVHDVFHENCDSVTLNVAHHDVTWKQPMSMTCSKHQEKTDYYCVDHKFIGCYKCVITDHRRCDEVKTIKEYCEKQKNNDKLDEMDNSLEKTAKCLELILNASDREIKSLQKCQDVGLKSISDFRERINKYLDQKQEEITQELTSKCKTEKAKVDLSMEKCSRLRASVQNTRDAFKTAQQLDDNLKIIQLFHRGQTEITAFNDVVHDMTHSSKTVTIKHDLDSKLVTIDESSCLTIGKVLRKEQPSTIPDGVRYICNVDLLSNRCPKELGTLNTNARYGSSNLAVLLMSNGNTVLSDYRNSILKLFSLDGQCLYELKINGNPCDLCSVDDDTLAVAVTNKQAGIHIVKVQPSKLILSNVIEVTTDIDCYGIAFKDGKFWVSANKAIYSVTIDGKLEKVKRKRTIHSVTMDGKVEETLTLSSPCWYLASDPKKNHIFVGQQTSTEDGVMVTRLPSGIHIYGLDERVVKDVMGVDVDREGNVYFCGRGSNNVVQVSANGTKVRELLTSKDGIVKPRVISVCGDKMVVTNDACWKSSTVNVYQLC